ncbi:MAG TPA: hypothetical protein V6C76_03085 [Drouetiella sp.]
MKLITEIRELVKSGPAMLLGAVFIVIACCGLLNLWGTLALLMDFYHFNSNVTSNMYSMLGPSFIVFCAFVLFAGLGQPDHLNRLSQFLRKQPFWIVGATLSAVMVAIGVMRALSLPIH